MVKPSFIYPNWPVPSQVKAVVTTRETGPSLAPYNSFNLGLHVGDAPEQVRLCRQQLEVELACPPINWLQQEHTTQVVTQAPAGCSADAALANSNAFTCAVLTADCLPVFFCTKDATQVAVAHAGWRGLAGGILENTVQAMQEDPANILAWLGPAIGPRVFEVGPEVRQAFLTGNPEAATAFVPSPYRLKHYMADLYRLATQRLNKVGVTAVYGGGFCTLSDSDRFYSYRRDGQLTGRMASLIWLERP